MKQKSSETFTEQMFRDKYSSGQFIEKSAIPTDYGFKSKKKSGHVGFPDFFYEQDDFAVVVEAKATNHRLAEVETQFYATNNLLQKDIIGIAVSGQSHGTMRVSYYFRDCKAGTIVELETPRDALLNIEELAKLYTKSKYGDTTSTENLVSVLKELNNKFHKDGKVRASDRSLFFSGLMIALNNRDFRDTYKNKAAPSKDEVASTHAVVLESHHLNDAIIRAISAQLSSKINNLSKQFSWEDKFSFIKNIDYSLRDYKAIIGIVEDRIFRPFKNDEKQDILGRAYKIFLSRAGKAENKNIILTPDHIKALMVKLACLTRDDVVLDTCTGSGGFLMESMETMVSMANGDPVKVESIKERQLIGFEIDSVLFALACSNMFLHGDGKTNLLYRSSLLNSDTGGSVNSTDADLLRYIHGMKPTKVIINPPYENNNSFMFTRQAIEYLEPNGKLVVIMPTPTLSQNEGVRVNELLKHAQLDFVIEMPDGLFSEQTRKVNTSIFGFTKTPHNARKKVLFYSLGDDGLVSVQHKGKLDLHGKWPGIESKVLEAVSNKSTIQGVSEMRSIVREDGSYCCSGLAPTMVSAHGYPLIRIGDLFDVEVGGLPSGKAILSGKVDFITAAEEWKKHNEHHHDKEALVYAVSAAGSLGRCHYVNGKFTASNLCLVLTPKKNSGYPINLEFYQNYFMVARPKIVHALAEGTSKKTISSDRFKNYLIEYIPMNHQKPFNSDLDALSQKMKDVEMLINEEEKRLGSLYHCFHFAPE